METKIYNTLNCGVYFKNSGTGIFIDGLFDGRQFGYSKTSDEIFQKCLYRQPPFDDLKALLFTHRHEDHFNKMMVDAVMKKNEDMLLYAPAFDKSNVKTKELSEGVTYFEVDPFEIFAIKTIHDGDDTLRAEPHVSYIINTYDETFFFAGDAVFEMEDVERIYNYCDKKLDAAFINPYQTMRAANRKLLRRLSPDKIYLIHRSLKEDDIFNMYKIFRIAVSNYPEDMPTLTEPEFYTWLE